MTYDGDDVFFIEKYNMTRSEFLDNMRELNSEDLNRAMKLLRQRDERRFYQLNPLNWIEDILGIKIESLIWSMNKGYVKSGRLTLEGKIVEEKWDGTPNPIQAIANSLVEWQDTAVESGTGTGKTFLAAALVLWFLAVYPMSKVYMVSTKKDALRQNLWPELEKHWAKFAKKYPDAQKMDLKVRMHPDEDQKEVWVLDHLIASVGADELSAGKAKGKHAEHMLFVMDEANHIELPIHEAIENTCTAPHNLRLLLGNPESTADSLHQTAIREDVLHIRISSYDHPNIVGNSPETPLMDQIQVIPGAVSWKSISKRRNKYGPDAETYNSHPLYQAMVRGICPITAVHSLFSVRTLQIVGEYLQQIEQQNPTTGRWIPDLSIVHREGQWGSVEGFTRIYEKPRYDYLHRYLIFADVGGDQGTGDHHAAVVLDRIKKKIVALIRMRGNRNYYIDELLRVSEFYRGYDHTGNNMRGRWYWPMLCWEKNAVGSLELSERFMNYPNLYIQRTTDKPKEGKKQNVYGWYTSSKNRSSMLNHLVEWGTSLRERPWRVPDQIIFEEMKVMEWKLSRHRYEARSGSYDDIMMAMAGALTIDFILPDPIKMVSNPNISPTQKLYNKKVHRLTKKLRQTNRKRGWGHTSWDDARIPKSLR